MSDSTPHGSHTPADGPAVGQDEWVARHSPSGAAFGVVEERLRLVPWWVWLVLFVAAFSLLPVVSSSGYVRRVGFDTVLYMLLALGLNVVVGWGGLLDLGFVAFYGIGAYTYAILDSDKFGIHFPTLVSVPIVVAIGAVRRAPPRPAVASADRRLPRDRHAVLPAALPDADDERRQRVRAQHHRRPERDPERRSVQPVRPRAGGRSISGVFAVSYLYVALAVFAVVFVALRFVNQSRTGRAWRSLREDSLAAEAMGMPVNWLKLMSFAFGAAVAALTGTLFAALNASVFPLTFYFVLLITVYTMVILGGAGNQAGVVLGAVIISPLLEMLRDPGKARIVFFVALVGGLAFAFRRRTLALVAGGDARLRLRRARGRACDRSVLGRGREGQRLRVDRRTTGSSLPSSWRAGSRRSSYIGLIADGARPDARRPACCASCCSCRRCTSRRSSGRT